MDAMRTNLNYYKQKVPSRSSRATEIVFLDISSWRELYEFLMMEDNL